jgi:hypothetical protein
MRPSPKRSTLKQAPARFGGWAALALLGWGLIGAPSLASAASAAPLALLQETAPAPRGPALEPVEIGAEQVARGLAALGLPTEGVEAIRVSVPELRRQLVYQFGSQALDSRKVDVFIEQERAAQLAAGVSPERFEVGEQEVKRKVEEALQSVREQYPTLDPAVVLSYNNIDIKNLERMTRQSTMFDIVFLPENPDEWPATTAEAIKGRMGEALVTQLKDGYAKRQEALAAMTEEERTKAKQSQGIFQMLLRTQVQQELNSAAEIQYASQGLPVEVAMRINGRDVLVSDVYADIEAGLSAQQVEEARRWMAKCAVLEAVLRRSGKLLSDEEFAPLYEAHVNPPGQSVFPMETVIRQYQKFPSMDVYRQYYRLLASYERMIAEEINDQNLQAHFDRRGNRMLNLGMVDVELILCSAFDFEQNRWKPDGWKEAAEEAQQVTEALAAAEGANWDELLERHSDFWDPPTPTQAQAQPAARKKNKGRMGPMNRNEMLQSLGESDYRSFLEGGSVTDEIFFALEEGQVGGPYAGPHGYYIARILSQNAPTLARNLSEANFRESVRQDYLSTRFTAFAAQACASAGLE